MTLDVASTEVKMFCAAVADDLRQIATLHSQEVTADLIEKLKELSFPENLGFQLQSEEGRAATQQLSEGLQSIPDDISEAVLDVLACEYADIYLNHTFRASPCESVWLDEHNLSFQDPMFQVRKYYEQHDLGVGDWRKRSDDHLVIQLQFLSHLFESGPDEEMMKEAGRFLDEHLLRWIDRFAEQVSARAATLFYAGLASVTACFVEELRTVLEALLEEPRLSPEEVEARMNPKNLVQIGPAAFVPGVGPTV